MPSLSSFLPTASPGVRALDQKSRDAAITFRGIGVGEDQKQPRFGRVGDPQLAAGEPVIVAVLDGARRQRERVRSRARLPRAHRTPPCPARDAARSGASVRPFPSAAAPSCTAYFARRRSPPPTGPPLPAPRSPEWTGRNCRPVRRYSSGDVDRHQPQSNSSSQQFLAEHARLIHFANVRRQALARKLPDGGLKQLLFVA